MADDSKKKGRKKPAGKSPQEAPKVKPVERAEEVVDQAKDLKTTQLSRPAEIQLGMMRSVITEPLLSHVLDAMAGKSNQTRFDVIIALNEFYKGGVPAALKVVEDIAKDWGVHYSTVSHYCFATLSAGQLLQIADFTRKQLDEGGRSGAVVYRIWEDSDISVTLNKSLATVKADAAQRAFQAYGEGIVWAVLDSGIQGDHPHFASKTAPFGAFDVLDLSEPLAHIDFTPAGRSADGKPSSGKGTLKDEFGHGTHVAGIIAGFWESANPAGEFVAGAEFRNENGKEPIRRRERIQRISGVAPKCKLVSMKVIADKTIASGDKRQTAGQGKVSWVLLAIDEIQRVNQFGKRLLIHGVNMSLGYDFDPRWFACGQSPICVEVNRLVKSGVSVVVSAGNSGYSTFINAMDVPQATFSDLSITDPGNAEYAITVGSTHKDMPHTYGVSYFSSRGPTGDGRLKPDMIAPGERIVSCAAGVEKAKYATKVADEAGNEREIELLYVEQSGTSMAAPHVSGAIAAFLSVRREFIGQPERVKEIFMANTIDLKRERCFQGTGLLDLMKVLQSV